MSPPRPSVQPSEPGRPDRRRLCRLRQSSFQPSLIDSAGLACAPPGCDQPHPSARLQGTDQLSLLARGVSILLWSVARAPNQRAAARAKTGVFMFAPGRPWARARFRRSVHVRLATGAWTCRASDPVGHRVALRLSLSQPSSALRVGEGVRACGKVDAQLGAFGSSVTAPNRCSLD